METRHGGLILLSGFWGSLSVNGIRARMRWFFPLS